LEGGVRRHARPRILESHVPPQHFTQHADKPSSRPLVREREPAYTTGAEQAAGDGWTVISVKDDWTSVFQQWM
jgi:hypothetical protein